MNTNANFTKGECELILKALDLYITEFKLFNSTFNTNSKWLIEEFEGIQDRIKRYVES